jgi:hypothetical protein
MKKQEVLIQGIHGEEAVAIVGISMIHSMWDRHGIVGATSLSKVEKQGFLACDLGFLPEQLERIPNDCVNRTSIKRIMTGGQELRM